MKHNAIAIILSLLLTDSETEMQYGSSLLLHLRQGNVYHIIWNVNKMCIMLADEGTAR
jgi:hypothetical protein